MIHIHFIAIQLLHATLCINILLSCMPIFVVCVYWRSKVLLRELRFKKSDIYNMHENHNKFLNFKEWPLSDKKIPLEISRRKESCLSSFLIITGNYGKHLKSDTYIFLRITKVSRYERTASMQLLIQKHYIKKYCLLKSINSITIIRL